MKIILNMIGAFLTLIGSIWFLQGINVLPGSFMTGQIRWAIYGGITAAVGVVVISLANQTRARHLSLSVSDSITVRSSLIAHKTGSSGEGFRVADDSGTSIRVDGDSTGGSSTTLAAPARHGEEGNDRLCSILMQRLNKDGASWVDCDCGVDSSSRDTDTDCYLYEISSQQFRALRPIEHKRVKRLQVQITRSIQDSQIWRDVNLLGTTAFAQSGHEASERLRVAIDRKRRMARKDLLLALDARETPGQVMAPVVEDFRKRHSAWVRSLEFQSVWLVGPTAELTFRLD